jgi:LAO/AO transport system ATPase/phenylacetic acid degradation protein PaaD
MNAITQHALDALRAGDRHAISRTISAVENEDPRAAGIARAIAPHLGHAHVIGVTGAPGAGKSTLINALLGELIARGQRIAVVAVDPSSPITGGAVLGDRIRMGQYGAHDEVFIRSVSSRGQSGGLSRTAVRIVDVLDAAGYDTVIVETVGAGQSDVAITELADTRVVVCPPGLGDDVQAIKAGILEIADIFVVNKADLPAADTTVRDLREMLRLRPRAASSVPVLKTTATRGEGLAALVDAALAHASAVGCGRRLATRAQSASEPGHTLGAPASRGRPAESASHTPSPVHSHAGRPAEREIEAVKRIPRLAARDRFVAGLGIRVVEGGAGHAAVTLALTEAHLNFNGSCHGGVIFALADTAFGLASNSRGLVAAGIDAHIAYHVAAMPGDTLTATAVEVSRTRKLAVYRVDVARGDATPIASFTGTVYLTGQPNEPHAAAT